jgi:two-component system, OmpR family, sensor histidine kinase VicK
MLTFSEIRHLNGIKGNFEVADEKEYVALATLQKAQPIPHLILSNIPEIVEQQQFIFDMLWNKAIPAKQVIKEIEQGLAIPETIIFSNYEDAFEKEMEMIKKARKEIQIIYSTTNAFFLQEKGGTLQLLKEMVSRNNKLNINILLPIDSSIRESLSFHLLTKGNINNNIHFQDIAPSIHIKRKTLVIDKKEALVIELKHEREQKATALIGFSFYSNSESIVLSYASIFEVLYNQSVLFQQLKNDENIKNEFINIAAHELRTPIMPILNGMEILEEKIGKKNDEYKQVIDIIVRNASRLQNLAESILQVSRIKSGNFTIHLQNDIDIHHLILQVIEDIEKKYMYTDKIKNVSIIFEPFYIIKGQKKKIKKDKESNKKMLGVVTDVGEKEQNYNVTANNKIVYPPHPPFYVNCDPQKISQVIFNLLDNALKFTAKGKIFISTTLLTNGKEQQQLKYHKKIKNTNNKFVSNTNNNIITCLDRNKNNIIITVKDTGTGVDDNIKDQLFEKFATLSTHGTGLGLYLSKKIIESHGGKIWYDEPSKAAAADISNGIYSNTKDKKQKLGSVFKFSLPIFVDSDQTHNS